MGSTRRQPRSQSSESNTHSDSSDDKFGFQSGSEFTFEEFEAFAKEFKELYFGTNDNEVWRPSIEEIEGEYWRIIEKPTDEVEVYYGADLETGVFGSGFPLESSSPKASTSSPKTGVYWNVLLIILLELSLFQVHMFINIEHIHVIVWKRIVGNIWFWVLQMNDLCVSQLLNLILQGKACLNGMSSHPRMQAWQWRCEQVGVFGLGLVGHCIWDKKGLRIVGAFGNEQVFGIVKLGREFVVGITAPVPYQSTLSFVVLRLEAEPLQLQPSPYNILSKGLIGFLP
ncbi:hypothetical protein FXO37_00309 [Capsicum annuum]|nr:hypothetical protein FXO37_00309 [Capsicum annuum]